MRFLSTIRCTEMTSESYIWILQRKFSPTMVTTLNLVKPSNPMISVRGLQYVLKIYEDEPMTGRVGMRTSGV